MVVIAHKAEVACLHYNSVRKESELGTIVYDVYRLHGKRALLGSIHFDGEHHTFVAGALTPMNHEELSDIGQFMMSLDMETN